MKGLVDGAEIEIPCTSCDRKTKKTIRWIKANKKFTCVCGTVVGLDSAQIKSEVAKVERHVADLMKKLRK